MSAAALTPRIRLMTVCDGVRESKRETGVYHVKGLRQRIEARRFPFTPASLWLLLVFSSPRSGVFPGYVLVVEDTTNKTVFYGKLTPPPNFEANEEILSNIMQLQCSFPQPGRYLVQTWFFQKQGRDVLKGELPFFVFQEGD